MNRNGMLKQKGICLSVCYLDKGNCLHTPRIRLYFTKNYFASENAQEQLVK